MSGVLHIHLLENAQLPNSKSDACQEGQNVGLTWRRWQASLRQRLNLGIHMACQASSNHLNKHHVTSKQTPEFHPMHVIKRNVGNISWSFQLWIRRVLHPSAVLPFQKHWLFRFQVTATTKSTLVHIRRIWVSKPQATKMQFCRAVLARRVPRILRWNLGCTS